MVIAQRVEWINKHKFVEEGLDENAKLFVVYVKYLETPESGMPMHLLRALLLAAFQQKEALSEFFCEYEE